MRCREAACHHRQQLAVTVSTWRCLAAARQVRGVSHSSAADSQLPGAARQELTHHGCRLCGNPMIIADIPGQPVIEKIRTHLGPQARAPPRATARGQALQAA